MYQKLLIEKEKHASPFDKVKKIELSLRHLDGRQLLLFQLHYLVLIVCRQLRRRRA